jgi:hypothetical protein
MTPLGEPETRESNLNGAAWSPFRGQLSPARIGTALPEGVPARITPCRLAEPCGRNCLRGESFNLFHRLDARSIARAKGVDNAEQGLLPHDRI